MKHARERRTRNRLLRGRAPRRGGGSLTLRQQIGQVLGVEPQVFADARELTVGDGEAVTTWGELTMSGGPLLDSDGWSSGYPTVNLDGSTQHGSTQVPSYTHESKFIWSYSGVSYSAVNADDEYFLMGAFSGTGIFFMVRRDHQVADRLEFYIRPDAGTPLYYDNSLELIPTGPIHMVCMWDGDRKLVKVMSASGVTTVMDASGIGPIATISGADTLYVGRGATPAEYSPDRLAVITATQAHNPTEQHLDELLNLLSQHYPIPEMPLKEQLEWMATVEPQGFGDAREIQLGDGDPIASFGNFEQVGAPTVDVDGWGGSLPLVQFDGAAQYLTGDPQVMAPANHQQALLLVMSLAMPAASDRDEVVFSLGNSQSNNDQHHVYVRFGEDPNRQRVFSILRDGTVIDDAGGIPGSDLDNPVLMHFGYIYAPETERKIITFTSDGFLEALNDTPTALDTDAEPFDMVTLMGRRNSAVVHQLTAAGLAAATLALVPTAAATDARLRALLRIHNAAFGVT